MSACRDTPPPYAAVVFDCDSTLSAIEGIDELAVLHGVDVRELTERAMQGEIRLEDVYKLRLERIRPPRASVEAVGRLYVARMLPHARELVAALRALEKRACIVSGGLEPAVALLARAAGFAPADTFAVGMRHGAKGEYVGFDESSPLARTGGKIDVFERIARASNGAAVLVGDGVTDLEAVERSTSPARFIAFAGVARREAVIARAAVVCTHADLAALVPLVFSAAEIDALARMREHRGLLEAAEELARTDDSDAAKPRDTQNASRARPTMTNTLLWIPGPTEVRPEILAECSRPMIGHRGKAMSALIERLDPGLKLAFGLDEKSSAHVAVHTTSATGLMESALKGVGPRVLCCVNGAFAKRWREIALLVGKDVESLDVAWGSAVEPSDLDRALSERGPFDAVTLVSNETSTGVRTPLSEIAAVLAKHERTLLLVDLVSYIAGAPVDFDANRIDFGFAGVQKAFALPPGVSVLAASARYLDSARSQKLRGFYLDPVKIVEGHEERATPCTPCIPLYFALARQLEDISHGVMLSGVDRGKSGRAAWGARFDEHARMQSRAHAWARSRDLELLPKPEHASPTISCIRAGPIDVAAFIAGLKSRGHEIGNGYGDLKGKTFRIGHMGDHTDARLAEMLRAADDVLAALPSR